MIVNDVLSRILSVLVLSIFFPSFVNAAANCEQYARNAVAAQQQNLDKQCGLTGARWSPDYNGHFNWCSAARQDSVDQEAIGRSNDIANCSYCTTYANEAITAQETNVKNSCNLSGPRWTNDRQGHFRWCMEARRDKVDVERQYRNYDAQKCQQCTEYSRSAVDANQQNLTRSCGFTGPEWTSDYAGHYNWCWNLSERALLGRESSKRADLLRVCQASADKKASCTSYAERAVEQYRQNISQHCNYPDHIRWHGNYQDHYGWCLAVDSQQPAADMAYRDKELVRCGGFRPDSQPTISLELRFTASDTLRELIIGGTGFHASEKIVLRMTSEATEQNTNNKSSFTSRYDATANGAGQFQISVSVSCPRNSSSTHSVIASGQSSGRNTDSKGVTC